jgi:NAD+ kinase
VKPAFSKIGVVGNPNKAGIEAAISEVVDWCSRAGLSITLESEFERYGFPGDYSPRADVAQASDMVIALGGDGTILSASRLLARRGVPLLGINIGGLGFLTVRSADQLGQVLGLVEKGAYRIEDRMMLEGEVIGMNPISGLLALNDFVIGHGAMARIFDLSVAVDDKFVSSYAADGLILATPTGSTAYSLSAGGPIVYPCMDVIVTTPICPHTLAVRPMIVPGSSVIEVEILDADRQVDLTADGQVSHELAPGNRVRIVSSESVARLIMVEGAEFFDVLRTKLKWGGRHRGEVGNG